MVNAKLGMVIADSPARSKVGGIKASRTSGRGCPYCSFDMDDLGNASAAPAEKRSSSHRCKSLECITRAGQAQHEQEGVRYSILNELPYYSTPLMCPPDYMHAVHLGLCKRYFHLFLVEGCKRIEGQLDALQRVLDKTMLPSTTQRPDSCIGYASGGNPSAQQWLTLFRHQLLFGLMEIWADSLGGASQDVLEFTPASKSTRRTVLVGNKPVEDVFEAAVLLAAIVDYMERRTFNEQEVCRLEALIHRFNRQQANLLGPGWVTYNSHITEHIPDFIRKYGSPRNFSCYAFESYNGVLARMRKCTRKGGALEDSLMRIASLRSELEREIRTSLPEAMRNELERFMKSSHQELGDIAETKMAKTMLENGTKRLLIDSLNEADHSAQGMYKSSIDPTRGPGDVLITSTAQHFHSLVKEWFPRPVRISSAKQGGSVNVGNTWVVARMTTEDSVIAQVLWLFKKRVRVGLEKDEEEERYYAHIRLMVMVSPTFALGSNHPCLDLMEEIGIKFGDPDGKGAEMVINYTQITNQVSLCPFSTINGKYLGVKVL